MKPELRRKFAQLSFEEKIRKVGELIQLSRKMKDGRVAEHPENAGPARTYPGTERGLPAADRSAKTPNS